VHGTSTETIERLPGDTRGRHRATARAGPPARVEEAGVGAAGGEGEDLDAAAAYFRRDRLGEQQLEGLGRAVDRVVRRGHEARDAGREDDAARAARKHRRQQPVRQFERGPAVQVDHAQHELERRVDEAPSIAADPRVVDQQIDLDGIGGSTSRVIAEALAGDVPDYLIDLENTTQVMVSERAQPYRDALRGDCHLHSTWSDGGAPVEQMALTAMSIGHEYMVQTDHSARLTIAHGLDEQRLSEQLDQIAEVNATLTEAGHDFRVLAGMEVDILIDGSLDLSDEMLGRLDVVVASVHSKLRMEKQQMTERMLQAIASPHVDILGHCTGRMIGKRPPSDFDADYVFAACAQFNTAVEINCRPERLDPPRELLRLAVDHDCMFTIDTDAHATGQLEWQGLGCDRAAECDVPIDRILNTRSADELLAWTAA